MSAHANGGAKPHDANAIAKAGGADALRNAFDKACRKRRLEEDDGAKRPLRSASSEDPPAFEPLAGIVERATNDPKAPFARDVLRALVVLRDSNRFEYETIRADLKSAGVRVGSLDHAIVSEGSAGGARGSKHAETLIELAGVDLFHTPDGTGYADVEINGHRETWGVRTKGFRQLLARRFFEARHGAPSSEALQSALNVIEARATFDALERPVFVRVGGVSGHIYLDLADSTWRAIEIDDGGWRVVDAPPVRFRRASGMRPLPLPVSGGKINALRPFLNVGSEGDFVLAVAWLLAALRNHGPYPVLVLSGEQGSAKSTFSSLLRALLDPNTAPLRALPREDRDLFIAARNGHVLSFDNVSGLPAWISDTLCRLATGGGFAVRQLYSDGDEVLFDAARPILLNGIEDIVSRPDLADRAIFLSLKAIPDDRRRPEEELLAEFERERPAILGALLDAMVHGLRRLPEVRLDRLPRLADFAKWSVACETAFWPAGTFEAAYTLNRHDAVADVIETDPLASAVLAFMHDRTDWTGTASELLSALSQMVAEAQRAEKSWPGSPRALSGRLRRAATFLRKVGLDVVCDERDPGRARARLIRLYRAPENRGVQPSAPSEPSAARAHLRTVPSAADGQDLAPASTDRTKGLEPTGSDGADGLDGNIPYRSGDDKSGDTWTGWL